MTDVFDDSTPDKPTNHAPAAPKTQSIDISHFEDSLASVMHRHQWQKMLSRVDLFHMALPIFGAFVECGCYKLATFVQLMNMHYIYEPNNLTRRIVGFDTFDGFKSIKDEDRGLRSFEDGYMAPKSDATELDAVIGYSYVPESDPNRTLVSLVKGDATKTIPPWAAENYDQPIAFLLIDFDLYEPCKVALEKLVPMVVKGGVIAFDDVSSPIFPGAGRALAEYRQTNDVPLKRSQHMPWLSWWLKE